MLFFLNKIKSYFNQYYLNQHNYMRVTKADCYNSCLIR